LEKCEVIDGDDDEECYDDVEVESGKEESVGKEATRTSGSWVHRVEGEYLASALSQLYGMIMPADFRNEDSQDILFELQARC